MAQYYDDHIWMMINGTAWAIHKIVHRHDLTIIHFWRGYEPHLEYCSISLQGNWKQDYSDVAHRMLEDHFGEISLTEV